MKHLLDVNVLIAAIWDSHVHHSIAFDWLKGKEIVLCPLAQLGFIRISTQAKGYNFTMQDAIRGLSKFRADRRASLIADDLDPLDSHPRTSGQVTDHYLADLAAKHGLKLATFDGQLKHASAILVS
jgi:uncharacterized protein